MYACGQGLNPRSLIGEIKGQLRKNGIVPRRGVEAEPVNSTREFRKVPMSRLIQRMGLAKYDVPAPIVDVEIKSKSLKIMLGQSIGAPSAACVAKGDTVRKGDVLGVFAPDKLGTSVHAPYDATVAEVTDAYVVLKL